jgi:hypothetical protein
LNNGNLSNIENLWNRLEELLRGWRGSTTVIDVVGPAVVGSRDDRTSCVVETVAEGMSDLAQVTMPASPPTQPLEARHSLKST